MRSQGRQVHRRFVLSGLREQKCCNRDVLWSGDVSFQSETLANPTDLPYQAWDAPVEQYVRVYADLSATVTQTLVNSGKPYLASNIWLNVNYPAVSSSTCSSTSDFKFVLSRINTAVPLVTPKDVKTCKNGGRLPTETTVVGADGCFASISVGLADTKLDASAEEQKVSHLPNDQLRDPMTANSRIPNHTLATLC